MGLLFFIMEIIADSRLEPQIGERFYASLDTRISTHAAPGSDGERERFNFVINTGAEDRKGTRIHPQGADIRHFLRNPMVLFNHDLNIPLGRAVSMEMKGDKLIGTVEFDPDDEFAMKIERKVKSGFINATSIGFIPKRMEMADDGVIDIMEWELAEFSIVTVPANPEALLEGRNASTQTTKEIRALKEEIASLRDAIKEIKLPAVKEDTPADAVRISGLDLISSIENRDAQTAEEKPTEAATDSTQQGESEPQQKAESTPEERAIHNEQPKPMRRVATEEDYKRLAKELVPVIHDQVLRMRGKR